MATAARCRSRAGQQIRFARHRPAAGRRQRRARPRRLRSMGGGPRRRGRPLGVGALCVARHPRLPGSRCQRHVAQPPAVRRRCGCRTRRRPAGRLITTATGSWQAPWGWTWVDDAPWGFAPYHYGRWAQVDDSWAWVPGPVAVERAARLCAGAGGLRRRRRRRRRRLGRDLAIGGAVAAGVAWFPLGPGEPWHPHGAASLEPALLRPRQPDDVVNNYNRIR